MHTHLINKQNCFILKCFGTECVYNATHLQCVSTSETVVLFKAEFYGFIFLCLKVQHDLQLRKD